MECKDKCKMKETLIDIKLQARVYFHKQKDKRNNDPDTALLQTR